MNKKAKTDNTKVLAAAKKAEGYCEYQRGPHDENYIVWLCIEKMLGVFIQELEREENGRSD